MVSHLIVSAVCREDLRFIDIFVGFPGRVHDARVFANSPLMTNGVQWCGQYHVLGDGAYPNLGWLLTPFKNNRILTANMHRYNKIHSSARITIERAFAFLKGRFRRLKYIDQLDAVSVSFTTVAACCLHNICLLQDDVEDFFDDETIIVPVDSVRPGMFQGDTVLRGTQKRNHIMNTL